MVLPQPEIFLKEFWIPRLSEKIQIRKPHYSQNWINTHVCWNLKFLENSRGGENKNKNILKGYTSVSNQAFWTRAFVNLYNNVQVTDPFPEKCFEI